MRRPHLRPLAAPSRAGKVGGMAEPRLTPVPTPADAEDDERRYAATVAGSYAGWVAARPDSGWAAYRPEGALLSDRFASRQAAAAALAMPADGPELGDPGGARRPHMSLYMTDAELAALQCLAAALGYHTRRAPHAGERGSVTALNAALARAAERDPLGALAVLRELFGPTEEEGR